MKINFPKHVDLALKPTPIQFMKKYTAALGGPEIYLKREDMTGIELTGNKVRKLEFLLADALDQHATLLITCGGIQSNHARATAFAAAKMGLKSHLVLRANGEKSLTGNLFLDRLVDAELTFISQQEYQRVNEIMARIAADYSARGQKAYVIPEGGSNEVGAFGYAAVMQEIQQQSEQLGLQFDLILSAVGSGGTQAGLVLGQYATNFRGELWGINVCDSAAFFQQRVCAILDAWQSRYQEFKPLQPTDIHIIDGYVGKGYALSRQEELQVIKDFARLEGIVLDPVYTGKAMYALQDLVARGTIRAPQRVLFLHTGGIFGIFPKRNLFF